MKQNRVTAIVLAAGQGKRMETSVAKQFLTLDNKPVIYYSLKAFEESSVDEIILVTGREQIDYCMEHILKPYQINKVSRVIEGGKERYESVYHVLKDIKQTDYVLIHDGARPFIATNLIEMLIEKVKEFKACILGTPVKETIKQVNEDDYITATPDRNTLWAAQTPQVFSYEAIKKAYDLFYADEEMNKKAITDDAMVYEKYMKLPVKMVMGSYHNLKLTTPEDLIIAETLLHNI
ncbi:2-C-methyl-D-erythritol 4-phosphate cytidylyltransferase [Mobilitalea sibirica]|uniref:2-C-methyl-D-erythritol 4-phosphate cytidylyltransferase n=1 Tax=Mobilitalea sibirica TaxID=1462919 RepID=A0A8J7HCT8_9FIRM|nr:2-C-methyl-D-erythritol 4-phosphate cytidylyltransferase [Mobilitalea sibirica]MBH1942416.1 2-C-methyl-D-erythritol 4-phosphate cytidylyltransferase [Mobilitalea sibirica]